MTLAYADDFEIPQFLRRPSVPAAESENSPRHPGARLVGRIWGAAGKIVRFGRGAFSMAHQWDRQAQGEVMRNGKDSMIGGGGSSTPGATGSGGGGQPFSVDSGADHQELTAPSSMVEDLAVALDRLRRIEGERQLYLMLEELLDRSRKVLVQHKVIPPQRETAEMESLRAQLKRSEAARNTNHAYASHYAEALTAIAGSTNHEDAQKWARDALKASLGEDEAKPQS